MSTERFTSFVINLLNNKTIILFNLAEYRLILADEALSIRQCSAQFRRIIVNYLPFDFESGFSFRDLLSLH